MGTILYAICENCQFEKGLLFFGGGMNTIQRVCNIPALEISTGKLVYKNIFQSNDLKGRFIFYNDKTMHLNTIDNKKEQWGDIILQTTHNLCPQCKSYSLTFKEDGCWD